MEKSSLIRHSVSAQRRAELNKIASIEQRTTSASENQAFLKDVCDFLESHRCMLLKLSLNYKYK